MGRFCIDHFVSVSLAICVAIIAAIMMRPSFAAIISEILIVAALAAMRWAARQEGAEIERERPKH